MKSIKNIVLAMLLVSGLCLMSCKKEKSHLYFREILATVVLSSGQVLRFDANKPPEANLGVSMYVGTPHVSVTQGNTSQIRMIVKNANGLGGPNQPGTYPKDSFKFECQYIPNLANSLQDYTNTSDNPGRITFTKFEMNYMEGNFSAYCKRGSDSVLVSGTFKGEF